MTLALTIQVVNAQIITHPDRGVATRCLKIFKKAVAFAEDALSL